MDAKTFIDKVASGEASEAKDLINDLLSSRAFESLEVKKIEIAQSLYSDGEDIIQFRSKEAEVELHSSSMRLNQAHADFKISDDVVALSADNILWNPDEKQFIGTNNIVLRSDLATVYGDYFYVNVPFKILKVSKNSRAKVYPSYE